MPLSDEDIARLSAQSRQPVSARANDGSVIQPYQKSTVVDWTASFLQSGVENTTNLFGVPKSASNVAWETENPFSAFAASMLGVGGTYGAFYKATKNIKRVEEGLQGISKLGRGPVSGGAIREAVRFAPLEAARIVGTTIGEPERLDQTLFEAGLNLSLGAGFGALSGLGQKFGTVNQAARELIPNVADDAPNTLKLRQLRDMVEKGQITPDNLPKAESVISRLDGAVRAEHLYQPEGSQINPTYVGHILGPTSADAATITKTGWVNSIFKPGKNKIFSSQLLVTKNDLGSTVRPEALRAALDDQGKVAEVMAKLPKHATSYMQYPRLVTMRSDNAKALQLWKNNWAQMFSQYEPGSYIAREADDGMFVFLKKVKGDPVKLAKEDEFLAFKTDRPDYFGGQAAEWTNRQVEQAMWWPRQFPQHVKPLPGSIHESIQKNRQQMTITAVQDLTKNATPKTMIERMMAKVGLRPGDALDHNARAALDYAKQYLAPAMFQFTGHGPGIDRARMLFYTMKGGLEKAATTAEAIVFGLPQATKGSLAKNLLVHGAKDMYGLGGETIAKQIEKLSDLDRQNLLEIWLGAQDLATVQNRWRAGEVSDNLYKLLDQLETVSNKVFEEMNATRQAAGYPAMKAKPGHYGLSHMWDGDWRVRINNENGQTVYMVGAKDRGSAEKTARKIISEAGAEGRWKFDASKQETRDIFRRGHQQGTDDLANILGINQKGADFAKASAAAQKVSREAYTPKTLEKQTGVGGFLTDMSNSGLQQRLYNHYRQLNSYTADMALRFELQTDLMKLADENPEALRQLNARWNDSLGIQGNLSQIQNDILDKSVVGAYMGNNSASQIVRVVNTVQHNLQLGSFNLMYPAVNMFTFMSTVMPQVSFAASAPAHVLQQYYTSLMGHGADGLAKRAVHVLDPLKMVYQGFKLMGRADAQAMKAFEQAQAEGLFAPRLVEEHIGVQAQLKQRLTGLLKEPNGFPKFIQYLSEWLPNKSEQFSRLHAFTTGLATGKEVLGLADEALYKFARDFTHNTMFGYGMVDRARVIQGPLGSFFGLYKNWQMHYLGWMLTYTGEAFKGNFGPLLWSQLGTTALAGIGGTTAYGVGDAFSRMLSGKPAFDHLYNMFSMNDDGSPDTFSDVAFYGLPAFLGLSVQSSASNFGANPAKDAGMLFSFVQAERGAAIGKAVGGAFDRWSATGENPFNDQLVRDQFLRAVAPRSIIRTAQVLEGDYIKSMNTGNTLIQGLSPMDRFVYGMGFNTPEIDRTYKIADELFKAENKRKIAVQYYARELLALQEAQDWQGVTMLSRRVMISGVGMDSVIRSAEGIKQRNMKDYAASRMNKKSPDYLQDYLTKPSSPRPPEE